MQESEQKHAVKLAIIGAGMAGMTLSRLMARHADVTVFEKARGVGGRMSTRYTNDFQFDHAAPCFTAQSSVFQQFLAPFIADGVVSEWHPGMTTLGNDQDADPDEWQQPHYVATPRMNSLSHALKGDSKLHLKTRIRDIRRDDGQWLLHDENDQVHGPFDYVVTTIPGPQAAALVPTSFNEHARLVASRMTPCYSLLLGFPEALDLDWQLAFVEDSPIDRIIVDSAKPGRSSGYTLLVHTSSEWAQAHIDDDRGSVQSVLLQELESLLETTLPEPGFIHLHSWLYATGDNSGESACLFDEALRLGVCGDWLLKGDVESAFLSALAMALKLKAMIMTKNGGDSQRSIPR